MSRTAWEFFDPVANQTYYWEINPNDGGYPDRQKNITMQATAAPGGKVIAYEGREAPTTFQFSGTILTQAQFEKLTEWFEKRNQIRLTDDLGRSFWIYIKSFSPRRVRSHNNAWRHTYTMECILLDWA